ncbi:MAG: pilin [Proteobacteria bacterium]|nr:pilin [Pseudomonadota bacterium]MBS1230942.1 pilin [Pseudomonadota bacterium]
MKSVCGERGFTLVELMLVVSIIGILAAVAIPGYQDYTNRARRAERFELVEPARQALAVFYERWGRFPKSNEEAGLPAPESFRGALVTRVEVREGAIVLSLKAKEGEREPSTAICVSVYRPVVHQQNPTGALLWVRDAEAAPARHGFVASAQDLKRLGATNLCPSK